MKDTRLVILFLLSGVTSVCAETRSADFCTLDACVRRNAERGLSSHEAERHCMSSRNECSLPENFVPLGYGPCARHQMRLGMSRNDALYWCKTNNNGRPNS
jgi:hypothetical protein